MDVVLNNSGNKWNPKPRSGLIWTGSKFRLDAGVVVGDVLYWKQQGVFLLKNPSLSRENSNQTISLPLCDKFGLFDGTIWGTTSLRTIVPEGVPMYQAFNILLNSDKGNGTPYDFKPILFNIQHRYTNTYYKLKQEAGNKLGDIFIDMAKTISSDVYYNAFGNMVVQSIVKEFVSSSLPFVYQFSENDKDLLSANLVINPNQIRNKVVVKGAIVNGYQFSAVAENNNLKSDYCIQYNGEIPEVINAESSLFSDELCSDRAMYDLVNFTRGSKTLNLTCSYLPIFDANQSILVNYPSFGISDGNYLIDSVSMTIGSNARTSLVLTNMDEVIF